jgi:flagellar motor switch protein FliM
MSARAQTYDLSTPAPLPAEVAKRLAAQKESIAEEMRIHLRRLLRLRMEVSVAAPEVGRVRHFANFLDGRAWWFAGGSKADPAGRSVLLGCAPSLIYAAVDRILGGPGSAPVPSKPPTAIEFELGSRFLRDVFQGLAGALELAPLHVEVAPHRPLAEPLLTYLPDLEEPFARIAWKAKVLDQEHELLLCISRKLLESAEPHREETRASPRNLTAPVAESPIELMVELARCRLTVDEASRLEKGDVVLFDLPPGEPIDVKVQGKTRLRARLGTHEGRYAIEVVDVVEPAKAAAATPPAPAVTPPNGTPSKALAASAAASPAAPARPRSA